MNLMRTLLAVLVLVLVCGCRTGPKPPPPTQVYFDSNPQGARIYLSYASGDRKPTAREYMGQTPCTNCIPSDSDGVLDIRRDGIIILNRFVPVTAVVEAESGTNTRTQTIRGPATWKTSDRVPSAMFFDFTRP